MNIEIQPIAETDKSVLRNLMELCQHDYSEYDGADVNEHGRFEYRYLDNYWTEPERHPFFIRVSGRLAGFVLVREVLSQAGEAVYSMAEFFVLRKYRRQGVGREAARQVFDRFPGRWSVYQEAGNLPAQSFWQRVIAEYTQGAYTEEFLESQKWHGPHQQFWSRKEYPVDKDLIARASIVINAPSEKVWEALVDPEAIQQYMFGTHVVSDWQEGSPIVWKGEWQGKPYEDKGVILQLEPGSRLQYSHFSPLSGVPDQPENYHIVTIELSGEDSRTRVALAQDHNSTEEERDHSTKNWEMMLASLKKYLEP